MSSRIVALLTDFGQRDPFVGMMKGVMLGMNSALQFVDIGHDITPQHIREAAIVLSVTAPYFPPQTIFLVVVDPGVGGARRPIIVETAEHLFVAPDNGVLGPVLAQAEVQRVVHATETRFFRHPVSRTFHGRDVFAPLVGWLSRGTEVHEMGPSIDDYRRLELPQPRLQAGERLVGEVLYRDRFGNLITNIGETWVKAVWGPPPWQGIRASVEDSVIHQLDSHYAQRAPLELGLVINSWGLFEIFANNGNAAQATGASEGSLVSIVRGHTRLHRETGAR
jgi:S-adenosylmethionine hydrolase